MRRPSGYSPTEPMIDLMATLCIVLFAILIVATGIVTSMSSDIQKAQQAKQTYDQDQVELQRLRTENDTLQTKLTASEGQVKDMKDKMAEIEEKQLTMIKEAQDIVKSRSDLYQELVDNLNANNIPAIYDKNKIIIKTGNDYASGAEIPYDNGAKATKIGAVLAGILDKYTSNPDSSVNIACIEVTGHTDLDKGYGYNDQLGAQRAYRYVDYMLTGAANTKGGGLQSRYLYGKYIKAASMSMYAPLAGTVLAQSRDEKTNNRRVEITMLFTEDDFDRFINKYKQDDQLVIKYGQP